MKQPRFCANLKCQSKVRQCNNLHFLCKGGIFYHFCSYLCMKGWCKERMKL